MYNKVILIGRTTAEPSLIYTTTGKAVSRVSLAVERSYKDSDGKKPVDFVPLVMWGKLAETVAQYVKKGKMIAVEGTMEIRTYMKDDIKMYITEVICSEVKFLEKMETEVNPFIPEVVAK